VMALKEHKGKFTEVRSAILPVLRLALNLDTAPTNYWEHLEAIHLDHKQEFWAPMRSVARSSSYDERT
jgi:hypothetical protein